MMPFEPEVLPELIMQIFHDDSSWSPSHLFQNKNNEFTSMCTITGKISQDHNELIQTLKGQAPVYWTCTKDLENSTPRFPAEEFNPSSFDQNISTASTCSKADLPFTPHCRRVRAILTAQQACDIHCKLDEITDGTIQKP
jgi:hypothetical protein